MEKKFKKALINSNLAVGYYNPSSAIKSAEHLVICADNQPILAVGEADDLDSLREAKELIAYPKFKRYIEQALDCKVDSLDAKKINGKDIKLQDEMIAIVDKDVGEYVDENSGDGELHWIVLIKHLPFATALCIDTNIQKIAGGA
jgi:hypothetical protein